jgi:predicted NBD/HSP70 family sugar kinase
MHLQGINAQTGKDHNRALILKMIKKYHLISRKDITKKTGLTKSAVTKIVNALIEAGLVEETESPGTDGRIKSLKIAVKNRYILSFYLSRMKITGAIIDFDGNIKNREEIYEGVKPFDHLGLISSLDRLIDGLFFSCDYSMDSFVAIGIAVPGAPVKDHNEVIKQRAFDWEGMGLEKYFVEKFNLPVLIENNSNLAALGEAWFGYGVSGGQNGNFIEYTIGAGIGSGVINQGMLYQGAESHICAIGHTTIDYRGEECFCGNRGCLDLIGGLGKLIENYREKKGSSLFNTEKQDFLQINTELKYILKKGEEGDPVAREVIREQSDILGIGVVTLINLYNPECIVVSADDFNDIDLALIIKYMKAYARMKVYPSLSGKVNVIPSSIGDDIYILGAYAKVLEFLFDDYGLLCEKLSHP